MRTILVSLAALSALALGATAASAQTGDVKVTPLGGKDGEFCRLDRALVFEDPNGTRVLYDPGMTVAGPTDPRLARIDIVLVTHMHGDHVGARHNAAPDTGECGKPDLSVNAVPNTNAVNIALAQNAKIVTGSEMPPFFAAKLKDLGGDPKNSVLARFGATQTIGGVRISTVPASHSNGVGPEYIAGAVGEALKAAGVAGYVGPPTGYILGFTNGLVVYLSGDTGMTAEQKTVVGDYYKPQLAVINIGDTFTTGPAEAAYVINDLVKPAAVIPSHANEAATDGGKVIAGTRTEAFLKAVAMPAHVPLSGRTMAFNGAGACVAGF